MNVAHSVEELRHLPLPCPDYAGIGVTGGCDTERGGQIEVTTAVRVPNKAASGSLPNNWPRTVWIEESHIPRFVEAEQVQNSFGWRCHQMGRQAVDRWQTE